MKKEAPVTPSTSYRTPVLICIGLLLLVFLPYAPVCVQGFSVLDDDDYVVRNSIVHAGITWKGFIWALTTNAVANWHPLTWLSHMLDCQLFGVNPGYHHLVNLLLHMANTVLLFLLFRSMTHTLWRSAFIAGLFAVHPLHVESVAWISERKDVLSAFFWILSTCAYVSYVRQPKLLRYLLVMILFALGLMAKPMLVTLPCVFLLLDYWPLERYPSSSFRKNRYSKSMPFLILEKLPLLALSLASSIITYVVQQQAGAVRSTDAISLSLRFGNAVVGYARYLAKALWPHDLAVYYPYSTHGLPLWQICIALLALGSITVFVLRHARERGYLFTGWFWFLGTLVPVIGIVQVGSQAIADRYMYVPIIGLFIMVTWIFAEIGTLILQRTFPEQR